MSGDFYGRLLALAAEVRLAISPTEIDALWRYYALLQRWNRRINLTSLPLEECPDATLKRLFVEPLLASRYFEDQPFDWIDLGSGGGSPAIPIKIVRPQTRLLMTESRGKKAAFLREVVRSLGLSGAKVSSDRFEAIAEGMPSSADVVSARGIKIGGAELDSVRGLLRPAGRLLLFGRIESYPGFDLLHAEESSRDARFSILRLMSTL